MPVIRILPLNVACESTVPEDIEAGNVSQIIAGFGGEALPLKANVAESEAVKVMVRQVVVFFGKGRDRFSPFDGDGTLDLGF
jgi:hypothetical protein